MKKDFEENEEHKKTSKPPCDNYPNYKILLEELYNKKDSAFKCLLEICKSIEKSFENKHHKLPSWEVKERIFDALTEIVMKLHKNEIYYKEPDNANKDDELEFNIENIDIIDEEGEEESKKVNMKETNPKKSQPTIKSLLWSISHNKIVDLVRKKVFRYDERGDRITKRENQNKNDEIIPKQDYIDSLEHFGKNFVDTEIFNAEEVFFYEELLEQLNEREREILELRTVGSTDEEIADILNIALKTVQNSVTKIKKIIKGKNK